MKAISRPLKLLAALAALFSLPAALTAATGEVSLSGSTWTGKVDGVTRYTGNNMAAASAACVSRMSSGTVRIYNGGNVNGEIRLKTNVYADCWGNTLTGVNGAQHGIIRAMNSAYTGVKNANMRGTPWFGMFFQTSRNMTFSGVGGQATIGFRIDNCKGGPGSNLTLGSPTGGDAGSHFFETQGITGMYWGTITARNTSNGCGVMLGNSQGGHGTAINGTRNCPGGGYATLRTGASYGARVGTVNSTDGGRGFFSLVDAGDHIINRLNVTRPTSVGVWLNDTINTKIWAGLITGYPNNDCYWVNEDRGGNVLGFTCRK